MKHLSSITEISKQRDSSLDAVSGFLIIFMMYCHLMYWSQLYNHYFHEVLLHVFAFYMVWFFFKGGLFAKAGESQLSVVSKSFHRLIVPYIIFSLIGVFFYWLDLRLQGPVGMRWFVVRNVRFLLQRGTFYGNLPLWFLFTLFLVRLIFNLLVRYRYTDIILALLILTLYLLRYLDVLGIGGHLFYPFWLYNTIMGLAYYWLGYRLRPLLHHPKTFLVSLLPFILLIPYIKLSYDFRSSTAVGDFLLTIVYCLASCFVAVGISRWFCHSFPISIETFVAPLRRLLIHFGKHSIEYLCIHWIIITFLHFSVVVPLDLPNGMSHFVVYLFGLIILLPLIRPLAKHCF